MQLMMKEKEAAEIGTKKKDINLESNLEIKTLIATIVSERILPRRLPTK